MMHRLKGPILKLYNGKTETLLSQLGRDSKNHENFVNPPIQRGSTVLFEKSEDLYSRAGKSYGLEGASTHDFLSEALDSLMGGIGTVLCPSGLSAITTSLLAILKSGDHLLLSDSVYGPTRRFATEFLTALGIECEFYEPRIGKGIEAFIKPNTKMIMLESPGSLTLELQDIPAILSKTKPKGIISAIDDTWSAGIYLQPLKMGVDISIQALTKYQGGHSDVLMGSITTNCPNILDKLKMAHLNLGLGTSPEDAWLCLRGMKTMKLRMDHCDSKARELASFLENRPQISEIIHPALASSPDNAIFKRDFSGAGALFSIVLDKKYNLNDANRMLDAMQLFGKGFSWGGFESLAIPCTPQLNRKFGDWGNKGQLVRFSIGLEHIEDLKQDFENGIKALNATA